MLLAETHVALAAFLHAHTAAGGAASGGAVTAEMAPLLPVLCAQMALYAEDDALHRSLVDR